MKFDKIGFIGLGLIGGSIAKTIRRIYPATTMIATAGHASTIEEAYADGTIRNKELPKLSEFADCDLIFLCCPVRKNVEYLHSLKPLLSKHCMLTDVGSVKSDIHKEIIKLDMEAQFIGGHPMTGSEKTGYSSATAYLLENAYYMITPSAHTPAEDLQQFQSYISSLGALTMLLDYEAHDHATASISHLPHVIAASLVNLIAAIDDENETMKTIAAGGFKDITRIASSSPVMWQNICLSNKDQIISLIDAFTDQLAKARELISKEDGEAIYRFFESAKDYRDSLSIKTSGSMKKIYEFYCDLIDEAGGIATIATLLAGHNLSIKNIGIIHNREFEQGVLHIEMYDDTSLTEALALLQKYHYTVYTRSV